MKALLVASMLTGATTHADTLGASLRARIGSIAAPFSADAQPIVRSELQAFAWELEGWGRIAPRWVLGARVALATSSVEEPAGSYVADYALGNALVWVEHARAVRPCWHLRARGALGLPLASPDDAPSFVRDRVLAASNALDGWRAFELYAVGATSLVAEAALEHARGAWHARARAKLAVPVRTREVAVPDNERHRVGLVPSSELAAGWRPRRWLVLELAAHAVALAIPPSEPSRDVGRSGRVHAGIAPQVQLVRGGLTISIEVVIALAGPLEGSAGVGAGVTWRR